MGPNDAGEVEIFTADPERPIVLQLPAAVVGILELQLEFAREIDEPAQKLVQNYREWDNGTCNGVKNLGKGMATCFGDSFSELSGSLFWTLEHFSDANFPLTGEQKNDLIFHTFNEADGDRGYRVSELKSTENSDSLDYCWYCLVRYLAIEERLMAIVDSGPLVQHHLGLIHGHYSLLLQDLPHFHELGWITTDSPKDYIERKLIDLAMNRPSLKPFVTHIIQNWGALADDGARLQLNYCPEFRSERLDAIGEESVDDADESNEDSDNQCCDILTGVRMQEQVMLKLRTLERVMAPETDDDRAWHHPLEFIEQLSRGRHVVFLMPAIAPFRGENLSNGQRFEFALMEHLAGMGFRHWLYSEPETHLHSIHDWLTENGINRSLKGLTEPVQQYMTLRSGMRIPAIRDFLGFPNAPEPLEVTQEIRYWQEVWDSKERSAAEVRLYMAQHDNERAQALEWMRASDDNRFIAIEDGGAFQGRSYSHNCTTRDSSLVVHHWTARPEYEWHADSFSLYRAIHFAAYAVGRKRGWGIHQSAVLPVKDNQRFLDAFEPDGELQDDSTALFAQFHVTTSGGYVDAAIFTAEDDHQDETPALESSDSDAGVPMVGAGR